MEQQNKLYTISGCYRIHGLEMPFKKEVFAPDQGEAELKAVELLPSQAKDIVIELVADA